MTLEAFREQLEAIQQTGLLINDTIGLNETERLKLLEANVAALNRLVLANWARLK